MPPEMKETGGLPTMRFRRTLAAGNLAVLELELTYADGSRYLGVSVLELRDGKVGWRPAGGGKQADAGSRCGMLCGGNDSLIDHPLLKR